MWFILKHLNQLQVYCGSIVGSPVVDSLDETIYFGSGDRKVYTYLRACVYTRVHSHVSVYIDRYHPPLTMIAIDVTIITS